MESNQVNESVLNPKNLDEEDPQKSDENIVLNVCLATGANIQLPISTEARQHIQCYHEAVDSQHRDYI